MSQINKSDVYILLPAFNEETVIFDVIKNIQKNGYKNIIVIDDGSRDFTSKKAYQAGAVVLRHIVNRGQGAAVATGIEYAKRHDVDYVIMMDSDGQFFADDIDNLRLGMQGTGADLVIGSRFLTENKIPFYKKVFNKIADVITLILSGYILSDTQTGFRMFGPNALDKIGIDVDGYEFCTDIIRIASSFKLKIYEVPVKVKYYEYANKKGQNFAIGIETFFRLVIQSLFR